VRGAVSVADVFFISPISVADVFFISPMHVHAFGSPLAADLAVLMIMSACL
jgi:hypothetical protein